MMTVTIIGSHHWPRPQHPSRHWHWQLLSFFSSCQWPGPGGPGTRPAGGLGAAACQSELMEAQPLDRYDG
eukprot:730972-Rhodomonas_salina.2